MGIKNKKTIYIGEYVYADCGGCEMFSYRQENRMIHKVQIQSMELILVKIFASHQ